MDVGEPTSTAREEFQSEDTSDLDGGCSYHLAVAATALLCSLILLYLLVVGPRCQPKRSIGNVFLYYGRFFVYYGFISFVAIFYIPIYALRPRNVANSLWLYPVAKFVSLLLGIKWELRGRDILDRIKDHSSRRDAAKGVIFIANHQSTLDSLGLLSIWNKLHPMATVIKKEVFYVWPFGLAAYLAGSIFIDRSRGKTALYSIEGCAHRAAKDKINIFMFPEGTRNRANLRWDGDETGKGILPFKSGAFRAAISAGLSLVPVVYSPYTFVDEERRYFDQGKAIIQVLPEIPTDGLTADDIPALMENAHKIISETYESLRKEVISSLPSDHFALRKKSE